MKFNVKLLESNSTIRKSIMEGLSSHIDSVISKSISKIQNELKTLLDSSLKQEPEYISLTSGRLRLEFGIADPEQVNNVVAKLADTVSISKKTTTITKSSITRKKIRRSSEFKNKSGSLRIWKIKKRDSRCDSKLSTKRIIYRR